MARGAQASTPDGIGTFLRRARERLSPADVGLAGGGRRRTPGLRREEVALLAGVSQTYYTYLEQGRPVQPSKQVLDAIAGALRLDPSQRAYLAALANPADAAPAADGEESVAPDLARLLDAVGACPAWIINSYRDVLAANHTARVLMADWPALPRPDRNIMRWLLCDPRAREVLVDWEQTARMGLARLRAGLARHPTARSGAFLDSLLGASDDARAWWDGGQILDGLPDTMRFRTPSGPIVRTWPVAVRPVGPSEQELMVHTPVPGTGSGELLRELYAIPLSDQSS